jgi:branched-chain amino acid aminotransferase
MKECVGNSFILNGNICPVSLFDNSLVYKGESVYEVIRMRDGIPEFFNDHMERLSSSLELSGKEPLAVRAGLIRDISLLTKADRRKEINIKIVFNYNVEANNYLIYYIESVYPSQEQYRKGVRGILFYAERNRPQSKVINFSLRNMVHQELANEKAYEALLVNDDNEITEGSRSNIFLIKNNRLVTAPDEVVLSGITRKHILDICVKNSIPVEYKSVNADDLADYESVFMTGTSPMVLPFYCINDYYFGTAHPLMKILRDSYISLADDSLNEFRSETGNSL